MKLAKQAAKLTPKKDQNPPVQEPPAPKKKDLIFDNPEETPQEPKGNIDKRALARQNDPDKSGGRR